MNLMSFLGIFLFSLVISGNSLFERMKEEILSLPEASASDPFFLRSPLSDTSPEELPPEIVLPDLRSMPPKELLLTHDPFSGGKLVRFTTNIWNSGPGILELHGQTDDYTGQIVVEQQLFDPDGERANRVEIGEFVYHPQHYHMHLDGFALYEVWSLTEDFKLDKVAASGGKISYCVMDVARHDPEQVNSSEYPEEPVYTDCIADFQGLSPGWIDRYDFSLPDQWVDISNLPNGIYALVSTVNPDHNTHEANEFNNQGVTYFALDDQDVWELGEVLSMGLLRE